MSLSTDGVWKAGVWAQTVWADGVWFEGTPVPPTPDEVKTGTGGIDTQSGQYQNIFKPTGLMDKPRRVREREKEIARLEAQAQSETQAEQLASLDTFRPVAPMQQMKISEMTEAEIDYEIGVLMRKRLKDDNDTIALMILAMQ